MGVGEGYWQALDEYTEALKSMCRERRVYSTTEPTYTLSTSAGPVKIPRRILDAEERWARAKTALRDAGRLLVHDPGDEDPQR